MALPLDTLGSAPPARTATVDAEGAIACAAATNDLEATSAGATVIENGRAEIAAPLPA